MKSVHLKHAKNPGLPRGTMGYSYIDTEMADRTRDAASYKPMNPSTDPHPPNLKPFYDKSGKY